MSIFQQMIDDVFKTPEFIEYFTADGVQIVTVCYEVDTDTEYTEYGVSNGCSFYLTCKVSDYTPAKGNKITFRNKQYKVSDFSADSFNLTYKIFLKDVNSK